MQQNGAPKHHKQNARVDPQDPRNFDYPPCTEYHQSNEIEMAVDACTDWKRYFEAQLRGPSSQESIQTWQPKVYHSNYGNHGHTKYLKQNEDPFLKKKDLRIFLTATKVKLTSILC